MSDRTRSDWTLDEPVGSLFEAVPLLRRPFTPEAVRWKVQAQFKGMTVALVVPYIDARLVVDRLNLVCPHLWSEGDPSRPELPAFEHVEGGLMLCRLTVDGVTRSDVGYSKGPPSTAGKGLYSDALKRAAVKFGIGVSLYAIPKLTLSTEDGYVEKRKTGKDSYSLVVTPKGNSYVRSFYEGWLNQEGEQAFGKPLDHGDSPGAGGDVEVEPVFDEVEGGAELSPEQEAGQQELSASIANRAKTKKATPQGKEAS